jgi:hypothetical protein
MMSMSQQKYIPDLADLEAMQSVFIDWANGDKNDDSEYEDGMAEISGNAPDFPSVSTYLKWVKSEFSLVKPKFVISWDLQYDEIPIINFAAVFEHIPTGRYFRFSFDTGSWDSPFQSVEEVQKVPSFDYV